MSTHVLEIDGWHPARKNEWEGRHWSVKNRIKAADKAVVFAANFNAGIPKATTKRRVRLTITLGPRQRGGDVDAYWKSLLDALKCAGLIIDDSKEWVETPPVEYVRGPKKATRIELEDIGDAG